MAQKGSQFERDMCRLFSRWVSGGDRDDLFWRTSQSGGRATACSRRGAALKTKGFYGDMALVGGSDHEAGKLFADTVSVEFKRGYNRVSIQDLLDLPKRAATRTFEYFLEQATHDATESGRLWLLVWKRDSRDPIVVMPHTFLPALGARTGGVFAQSGLLFPASHIRLPTGSGCVGMALALEAFFEAVTVKGVSYDTWRTKETPRPAAGG
jgi:hypothetical protein